MSKLIIRMSKLIIRMSELIKWTSNLVNILFVTLYTVYFTFLSLYTINIFMSQTVTPTATHSRKDATEWLFGSFSSFWLTPFSSIQQTNPFMLRFPVVGSRCTFPRRFSTRHYSEIDVWPWVISVYSRYSHYFSGP